MRQYWVMDPFSLRIKEKPQAWAKSSLTIQSYLGQQVALMTNGSTGL